MTDALSVPFVTPSRSITSEWIDYNGHLNMAYYLVIFDEAADVFWTELGLGAGYQQTTGFTTYTASCKIDYLKEVPADALIHTEMLLLALHPKKFMTCQGLYTDDGTLCAAADTLTLHIDQTGDRPRVAAFSEEMFERMEEISQIHLDVDPPHIIGRPIEMERPKD